MREWNVFFSWPPGILPKVCAETMHMHQRKLRVLDSAEKSVCVQLWDRLSTKHVEVIDYLKEATLLNVTGLANHFYFEGDNFPKKSSAMQWECSQLSISHSLISHIFYPAFPTLIVCQRGLCQSQIQDNAALIQYAFIPFVFLLLVLKMGFKPF